MSVRKRTWTTRRGEAKEAWIVDYVDQRGERHIKTFARKKDADAHHAEVAVDVSKGIHTPESRSLTVKQAAEQWLAAAEIEKLERSTLDHYRTHVIKHIVPKIGASQARHPDHAAGQCFPGHPAVANCRGRWRARCWPRSVRLSRMPVAVTPSRTTWPRVSPLVPTSARSDVWKSVAIFLGPTKSAVSWRLRGRGHGEAFLVTAAFSGLRASELRGLRWSDVDLARGTVHVRQRADAWGSIGQPKTHTGQRAIPIGPYVVNVLKEWRRLAQKVSRIWCSPAAMAVRWCTRPCSVLVTGPRSACRRGRR